LSTELPIASDEFRAGPVIAKSLALLRRHLLKFLLLSFVAALPPLLLAADPAAVRRPLDPHYLALALGSGLLTLFLLALCQPAILFGAFQTMRGRDFELGEALGKAIERLMPVVGVSLLMLAAILAGSLLLLVPGLMFWTMFLIAIPVCVVERLGPIASLRRSAGLTKGNRLRLFGLFLVLLIGLTVLRYLVNLAGLSIGGPFAAGILDVVFDALSTAFELVAIAVVYHDLRVAKEGIDIEQLAALFD
jgi:hypothetical protein